MSMQSLSHEDLIREIERLRMEAVDSRAQLQMVCALSGVGWAQVHPLTSRLLRVNDTLCAMLGYTESELLSTTLADLTHPDDGADYVDRFSRLVREDSAPCLVDLRLIRKDGGLRMVHMHLARVRDSDCSRVAVVLIHDLNDRQAIKEKARQQAPADSAFIRQIIDTDPNFVFAKDREGRFTLVNQAVADCYGTTVEELLGKTDADFNPDSEQVAFFRRMDLEIMDTLTERIIAEEPITDAAGNTRWLHTVKRPIVDESGRAIQVLGVANDITQRKRGEQELARVKDRLTVILEAAGVGIYGLDRQGRATFVNPAGASMFGYEVDDLLGRNLHQILHHSYSDGTAYPAEDCPMYATFVDGHSHNREDETLWRKDGRPVAVSFTSTPIIEGGQPVGAVVVVRDVTERRRAQEALRESEERLRLALAAGQMGAWDIDLQTDETRWDAWEVALLGAMEDSGAATPERFFELVHPDDVQRIRQAVRRAIEQTGSMEHEFRIVRPDGEVRWLVAKGQVLKDDRKRPMRMVGVNFDVTERKRTDDRLRSFTLELEWRVSERTRELQRSHEQLRALATELNLTEQRERKRLATDLHDYLAQLLVLVRLKLGQLKRSPTQSSMADLAHAAEEAVNEALTYTRTLVAQLSPPVLHEFGLPAALHWLTQQMVRQELSVDLIQRIPDALPLPEDQAVLLFQSVRELLMNIKKHAGTHEAAVTIEHVDQCLVITIRDEGVGIDVAAVMPSESSTLSSKFGLFSIRERMRAIGGSFELESLPGRGTTARLSVPYGSREGGEPETDSGWSAIDERPLDGRHERHEKPQDAIRVLLVDDHMMVREGLRTLLKEYGDVKVVGEAWDGEEAVAFVDRLRPDVVVMDVNMPRLDGIEATRRIKAAFRSVAVIGMSVNSSSQVEEAMRTSGADAFLSKEAAGEQIYQAITAAVKRVGERIE